MLGLGLTLPSSLFGEKRHLLAATRGAGDAIRPAANYYVVQALVRVREVLNSLLQGLGFAFHVYIIQYLVRLVKYIIT